MDEEYFYEDYNEEPTYHSYSYNIPEPKDDWYEIDGEEE